jgi:hypothetical protein
MVVDTDDVVVETDDAFGLPTFWLPPLPTGRRGIVIGAGIASFGSAGRGVSAGLLCLCGESSRGAEGKALEKRERPLPGVSGSNEAMSVSVNERESFV